MKTRSILSTVGVIVMLVGCAAPRQSYVELNKENLSARAGRVGVIMTPLPQPDTRFPGADCLLCLATASVLNSSLTSHTRKLPLEGVAELKTNLAELIRAKGGDAVVIADELKVDALPDCETKGTNIALKDFSGLKQKYSVDRILVIDVPRVGMYRYFSAYIPSGDPQAEFELNGYMVNLSDNTYQWYQMYRESRGTAGNWDEPPGFPGLTNAYFQTLETGKDNLLGTFK